MTEKRAITFDENFFNKMGQIGSILSVMMYVSYIPQITNNLAGNKGSFIQPLVAMINLHPALLPSFRGAHAIQDAYEYGVKVTGVTVHLANADYDRGPIIAQRPVVVEEDWTVDQLEEAIHQVEHQLYPEVLQLFAQDRVHVEGQKVRIEVGK